MPWLDEVHRPTRPPRLPTALTPDEVGLVLMEMHGTHALVAKLLFGTGMRLMEGLKLRVKDVDFARREIIIREGKGAKEPRIGSPCCRLRWFQHLESRSR